MDEDCLFCEIIEGNKDADIVFEDDQVLGFRDINPQAPHHLLIVPKKHIPTVNDITSNDEGLVGHLFTTAREIADQNGFSQEGYRLVMNCGENAKQSIFHLHLHCLAGRSLNWPPG